MIKEATHSARRLHLVNTLKSEGINDILVLDALANVPRHKFIENALQENAYANIPLPIGYQQTISQPYIVAIMTQEGKINKQSKVLEIGTGCGYQTAILASICQSVFSIEIIPDLATKAEKLLKELGYNNIKIRCEDGHDGWPEAAPFDAIIVTAAAQELPNALLQQLAIGGNMIIPLVNSLGMQVLTKITKISPDNQYKRNDLLNVRFVPMTGVPKEI
jgi:protein-L-isoaspartate(D-aspartate) O-methyltransferase